MLEKEPVELCLNWYGWNERIFFVAYLYTYFFTPQVMFDMTGKEKDVAFVSLMQPDMRARKAEGKTNNTIGFYIMKVYLCVSSEC